MAASEQQFFIFRSLRWASLDSRVWARSSRLLLGPGLLQLSHLGASARVASEACSSHGRSPEFKGPLKCMSTFRLMLESSVKKRCTAKPRVKGWGSSLNPLVHKSCGKGVDAQFYNRGTSVLSNNSISFPGPPQTLPSYSFFCVWPFSISSVVITDLVTPLLKSIVPF